MINIFKHFSRRRFSSAEIDPEDIFIDSSNLPDFDTHQFQGRMERSLSRGVFIFISSVFIIFGLVLTGRLWFLGVHKGEAYAERSEKNRLHESDVFSNRGVIFDRNGVQLAWNSTPAPENEFALRSYATSSGVAHVVGYVKYPVKDSAGIFFRKNFLGEDGVENIFNEKLSGENGVKIVETDALGRKQSESVARLPVDGENISLSLDARLSDAFYTAMRNTSEERGFTGGSAVMMDVVSGEVIVMANFPEYDSNLVTEGKKEVVVGYQNDARTPFLNRAVAGLYTPGSIIKPIVALGALQEKIISPSKEILSTGSISIQNPYFPDKSTVFNDWKAHGWVDMRKALAVSSDVYFYEIGGGYEDQLGLGVARIEKYLRMFGLGSATGFALPHEKDGLIPNPVWKESAFDGDPWRVGDTYNISIGQYGMQITPLQAASFTAALANGGKVLTPTLLAMTNKTSEANKTSEKNVQTPQNIPIDAENFEIVREGMRRAVTEGTASGLNVDFVEVAGKTGTAELGSRKQFVNSWSVGFFPYQNPRYAFAVVMEKGPHTNTIGATYVVRTTLDWMAIHAPEYFQN